MGLKLSPRAVRRGAMPLVRALAGTWRFEEVHPEHRAAVEGAGGVVALLWHEFLLPLVWHYRGLGYAAVISRSRDGRYVAAFAESLGFRVVTGSSSRGGGQALLAAVRELRAGRPVAFTPDGPRGPRRQMKPGGIAAAQQAGVPVIALHVESDRAWRLDSWDRFMLPRPWARVRVVYSEPFMVEPGPEGLARGMERAATLMTELAGADR